jgi:hypothetical protein
MDNGKGYKSFNTSINGVRKKYYVHRVVALLYIPNPKNLKEVNHKNGIKSDNRVENLEWCTRKENVQHAYKNNLVTVRDMAGNKNPNYKEGKFIHVNQKSKCLNCGKDMIKIVKTNKYCSRPCYYSALKTEMATINSYNR